MTFQQKMNEFIKYIPNNMYILEITKKDHVDGHFILIYKNDTLLDLYKLVSINFHCKNITELYVMNNDRKININLTNLITIENFIENNLRGRNLYRDPNQPVYQVFYNDDSILHI
jgi:hypothetical protein